MTRGPRVLAAIGMTAALIGVPIGPVTASSTICVGIVVDYGAAKPGGGANSFCARVPAGATGAAVLAARARALGRPAPTYRSDGLLCTVDGYPNDGSCAEPATGGGFRYWSYWHMFPGASTWTYSAAGPSGFTVANGELEGWAFQNGGPEGGRRPPAASYSSVCRPSTTPPPTGTAAPAPSGPAPSGPAASPAARRTSVPSASPKSPASHRPTTTHGPAGTPPHPQPRASASTSSPPASSSAALSADPSLTALSPMGPRRRSPSRAPLTALAGVALAGGIGAAALLRTRRSRGEGGG